MKLSTLVTAADRSRWWGPADPDRPVDWRAQLVRRAVATGELPPRGLDPLVEYAILDEWPGRTAPAPPLAAAAKRLRAPLSQARALAADSDRRYLAELLALAGYRGDLVAARLGVENSSLVLFSELHFDLRGRRNNVEWLLREAVLPELRFPDDPAARRRFAMKVLALTGGPTVLRTVLANDPADPRIGQAATGWTLGPQIERHGVAADVTELIVATFAAEPGAADQRAALVAKLRVTFAEWPEGCESSGWHEQRDRVPTKSSSALPPPDAYEPLPVTFPVCRKPDQRLGASSSQCGRQAAGPERAPTLEEIMRREAALPHEDELVPDWMPNDGAQRAKTLQQLTENPWTHYTALPRRDAFVNLVEIVSASKLFERPGDTPIFRHAMQAVRPIRPQFQAEASLNDPLDWAPPPIVQLTRWTGDAPDWKVALPPENQQALTALGLVAADGLAPADAVVAGEPIVALQWTQEDGALFGPATQWQGANLAVAWAWDVRLRAKIRSSGRLLIAENVREALAWQQLGFAAVPCAPALASPAAALLGSALLEALAPAAPPPLDLSGAPNPAVDAHCSVRLLAAPWLLAAHGPPADRRRDLQRLWGAVRGPTPQRTILCEHWAPSEQATTAMRRALAKQDAAGFRKAARASLRVDCRAAAATPSAEAQLAAAHDKLLTAARGGSGTLLRAAETQFDLARLVAQRRREAPLPPSDDLELRELTQRRDAWAARVARCAALEEGVAAEAMLPPAVRAQLARELRDAQERLGRIEHELAARRRALAKR
ncbi:MAG: hypothetical protein CMJ58_27495 [Planctomycetaceae bacterium]|nr:hypothetical protein [Planctomycetaceae bacterium]